MSSSSDLITCLRGKSDADIFSALRAMGLAAMEQVKAGSMSEFEAAGMQSFYPTIDDGEFFPENPLTTKFFNPGNMIVGYNSDEFGFIVSEMFLLNNGIPEEQFNTRLEGLAQTLAQGNAEYVPKFLEKLKLVYKPSADAEANKKTLQRANADSVFVGNAFRKADKHSASGNKVFMYELLHGLTLFQDHSLLDPELVNVSKFNKPADVGGDHTDDIFFTFGFPFNPNFEANGYNFTDGDRILSGLMMNFWGEFARTGTMLGWPVYTTSRRAVMQLDRQEPYTHIAYDPRAETVSLWAVQIPLLLAEMGTAAPKPMTETKPELNATGDAGETTTGEPTTSEATTGATTGATATSETTTSGAAVGATASGTATVGTTPGGKGKRGKLGKLRRGKVDGGN